MIKTARTNNPSQHVKARAATMTVKQIGPTAFRIMSEKVYYIGTNERGSFRPGEAAEITGVTMETPEGQMPRPCFSLRYADDKRDSCPISDVGNYRLTGSVRCQWIEREEQ